MFVSGLLLREPWCVGNLGAREGWGGGYSLIVMMLCVKLGRDSKDISMMHSLPYNCNLYYHYNAKSPLRSTMPQISTNYVGHSTCSQYLPFPFSTGVRFPNMILSNQDLQ